MLLWLGAVIYGFTTGPVRQLFMIGAMLVGGLIGSALAGPLSIWTGPMSGLGREAVLPLTFAVLVILIALVLYVIVIRTYPNTRMVRMPALDSLLGGIAGFVTGLVGISMVAAIITDLTRGQWAILDGARANVQSQISSGPLFPWIADSFPLLAESISRLLPQA